VIPKFLTEGVNESFSITSADYKSQDWDLEFTLVGAQSIPTTATAQSDGSWLVEVDKSDSDGAPAGTYGFSALIRNDDGAERVISNGVLTLLANLKNVDEPYDPRSRNQRILDNVRAAIEGLVSGKAVQSYEIEGRKAEYYSLAELVALESRYQFLVDQEQAASRGGSSRRSKILFR